MNYLYLNEKSRQEKKQENSTAEPEAEAEAEAEAEEKITFRTKRRRLNTGMMPAEFYDFENIEGTEDYDSLLPHLLGVTQDEVPEGVSLTHFDGYKTDNLNTFREYTSGRRAFVEQTL